MCGARKPTGFTLVELVVVVMILGILATIAVPKLLSTGKVATDTATRQSLNAVRIAIEKYTAEHGTFPGADGSEATFLADIGPYLRGGEIPMCRVDEAQTNLVQMRHTGDPLPGQGQGVGSHSWVYSYDSGEFHINWSDMSTDGETAYCDF